jgi:hypothetical protein
VLSLRKREQLARKEKELGDFRAQHPWFGQIEGYQREIIRRMIYQGAGRELEAKRLEWVLFRVGDMLGKEVIWPILSHLLDGGTFHCHGMQICGVHPNVQKLPSLPFEQFLADHVAPGTRPGQLVAVEMLLKAWAVMEEEWGRSLQNQEEPAGESAAVMTPQVPSKAEG